jgi:esterase/lipase superfamily enzyme
MAAPTFPGVPAGPMPAPPPVWVIRAALAVRGWLLRLVNAITPPPLIVLERAIGVAQTMAIATFAKHYVPLLDEGPIAADAAARRLGRDPDATFRFLHFVASAGFVAMRPDGRFEHNRVSRILSRSHPSRAAQFVEYFASGSNVRSWLDMDVTLVTGKNAFERVHGMSVWDWFDQHPDERECFAEAMMGFTLGDSPFVAAGYPFKEVTTICDVGGGRGTLVSELLLRHPHLRATLVDAAGVLDLARALLEHRKVADRVTLTPGNFFEKIPSGAELYTLKNVLHDWDDERSLVILRNVRAAMQPGQKILIIEAFIDRSRPDPLVSGADMQMMMVCGEGRERSEADFRKLLEQAGFTPTRAFPHPVVAMVEAVA